MTYRLAAVIPTRDRPDLLADCLETLVTQDAPEGLFEVVVVDDGSEPPLAAVVERFADRGRPVRCVRQEPSGLNVGRNTGATSTHAPLVAYLDDDTLVDPRWAAEVVRAFDTEGADAVACRIVLQLEGEEPAWLTPGLRAYLSELDLGGEADWLGPGRVPFGAACAVTRDALEGAGWFAAGLDRIGGSLVSNGELELFERVRARGGRILYWPSARVLHRVPAARLTLDWFHRRARAQGVSDALLHPAVGVRRLPAMAREIVRAARAGPILVRSLARGKGTVAAALWLSYCSGRFMTIRRPDLSKN